jgi:hypothetical protein
LIGLIRWMNPGRSPSCSILTSVRRFIPIYLTTASLAIFSSACATMVHALGQIPFITSACGNQPSLSLRNTSSTPWSCGPCNSNLAASLIMDCKNCSCKGRHEFVMGAGEAL